MPSDFTRVRFLLDEHYPGWLAEDLTADGYDTVALTAHRPELRGADDGRVLAAAVAEGRVVVTEDVSTFSAAIALVPDHLGVVYCHHMISIPRPAFWPTASHLARQFRPDIAAGTLRYRR